MNTHTCLFARLGAAAALLLALDATLPAQTAPAAGTGALRIQVLTRTRGPVPGATVVLGVGAKPAFAGPALKTDSNGVVNFTVPKVDGPYWVRAWANGVWGQAKAPAAWWTLDKPARVTVTPAGNPPQPPTNLTASTANTGTFVPPRP